MCLFPDDQCCVNIPPPTRTSKKYVTILKFLMFLSLAFGILLIFAGSLWYCILQLLATFLFWQGYSKLDFCQLIIIIFLFTFQIAYCINYFGEYIQKKKELYESDDNNHNFAVTILMLYFAYLIVSVTICFYAYREFKALQKEMGGGQMLLQQQGDNGGGDDYYYGQQQQFQQQQQQPQQQQSYQQYQPPALPRPGGGATSSSQQQQSSQQQAQTSSSNQFKAFGGKGVQIG